VRQQFEKFVREGRLERFKPGKEEIENLIRISLRDIETARKVKTIDWDWSFVIAYNSVLQAARSYILSKGFRPKSYLAHKTVFEFLRISLPKKYHALIDYFDKIRIKRHRTLYEAEGIISEKELDELINKAKEFTSYLKELLLD